jgi:glycosyltransferase involved in cell wall biosynthesis
MHILIIPSWYKTPEKPVTGTFFEEQARMFQKRGHQVGVLFPQHNLRFQGNTRQKRETSVENYNDKGLHTFYSLTQSYVPKIETPTKFDILQITKTAYEKFKHYVKENGKPDVIHAHSVVWGGVVANYISQKENIPYFLTKHYTGWIIEPRRSDSKAFRKLLNRTVANSEKTFVVSSYYKDELLKKYPLKKNKLRVMPNIVNSIFYENRCEVKIGDPMRLIVIAYLIKRKNHIMLFQAIKLLKERGVATALKVVGNGAYEKELRDYVSSNGLEKDIHFAGLLSRFEIVEAVKESHVVISASTFETFGVNIIEGLAIGRPCVVLDSGGPRDIIRKKDGILFSENSSDAFANAIQEVISNYKDYNQNEIAASCNTRFGEHTIYKMLYSEYLKI